TSRASTPRRAAASSSISPASTRRTRRPSTPSSPSTPSAAAPTRRPTESSPSCANSAFSAPENSRPDRAYRDAQPDRLHRDGQLPLRLDAGGAAPEHRPPRVDREALLVRLVDGTV